MNACHVHRTSSKYVKQTFRWWHDKSTFIQQMMFFKCRCLLWQVSSWSQTMGILCIKWICEPLQFGTEESCSKLKQVLITHHKVYLYLFIHLSTLDFLSKKGFSWITTCSVVLFYNWNKKKNTDKSPKRGKNNLDLQRWILCGFYGCSDQFQSIQWLISSIEKSLAATDVLFIASSFILTSYASFILFMMLMKL